MSAPPYMKLFWGDYHKATRHLRRDQHGAYFLLIGEAWRLGGALPDDDDKLAAWALCTPEEWSAVKPIVMDFFTLRRGKWWHDRVREELASYEATSRKRKEAGKKGGKASVGKESDNQEANAYLLPPKPEPEPEPVEETPLPPEGDKRRKPKRSIPDGFPEQPLIDEQQAKARAAGANIDIANQAERFRNWSISKDSRYADWPATWRNWCDRAIRDAPKTAIASLSQRQAGAQPDDARWRSRLREFRQNRFWPTDDAGPRPGAPGCRVPPAILAEFGFSPTPANDTPKPDLFAEGAAA